jgi:hypothetical protein
VPHELGGIGDLQFLFLFANNLSGVLPRSLYNLSSLKNFGVEYNLLSGTLPIDKTFFGLQTKHKFPNALSSAE